MSGRRMMRRMREVREAMRNLVLVFLLFIVRNFGSFIGFIVAKKGRFGEGELDYCKLIATTVLACSRLKASL